MKKIIYPAAIASLLFVGGCATTKPLSDTEVLTRYKPVATLQADLAAADTDTLSVLAQDSYQKALAALETANKQAKRNNPSANETAMQGKLMLERAQAKSARAQDVLAEVIAARNAAVSSGAFQYAPEEMQAVEADFKAVALKLERGESEAAKIRRPELIRRYSAAEVKSLKGATVDNAKSAIQKAREYSANKYAKKTFALAENELAIAVKLIEGDKSRKQEAERHAKRTIELAEQAMGITDTVKEFRENDFTYEEMVLWHQEQLQKAVQPLNASLKVDRPHHHIIAEIRTEISDLMADRAELESMAAENENRLEQKLVNLEQDRQQQEELALANRKKLEFIQNLFDAQEANVYLQKEDVLIRAQGFHFPVGQSEIDSKNFSLLHKIAQAISQYPNATIFVTGHTDNTGRDEKNLSLSRDRAMKVAKFLSEFGGVSATRIRVDGYGEGKPVASNDTEEGRSANRRVEILIQNRG